MKLIILLTLFCITACTSKKRPDYIDFPQEKHLKAYTIELDTVLFRYPFRIRVIEDKAFVLDLHGINHYCHVFQYPGFKHLNSFGKRGESPEEMLSAENIRHAENNNEIWTLDANKSELTGWSLSPSGDSYYRKETVYPDKKILRALDFAIYNDTTFIIPDYSGENRFCWVNCKGELLRKTGSIPSSQKEALQHARPALAQAWRSFIDYNPRNDVLAVVTQLGEVLEIYHLQDSTHMVRVGPHGEPEYRQTAGYAIPTGIMGFSDVQVTDNYIYAVFHGRTFKEIARRQEPIIDGGQYIYVFSLQGEPVCKYVLDRFIYGISVNEETKTITATDVNSDEPMVEFRLQ